MTGTLLAAAAIVTALAVGYGAIQHGNATAAAAETAAVQVRLDDATATIAARSAELDAAAKSKAIALSALAGERSRADAANAVVLDLQGRIARDAGTARDGATAPVLQDAIRGLTRTGVDSGFVGRMVPPWRLLVTVDGRVVTERVFQTQRACRDFAFAEVLDRLASDRAAGVAVRCVSGWTGGAA